MSNRTVYCILLPFFLLLPSGCTYLTVNPSVDLPYEELTQKQNQCQLSVGSPASVITSQALGTLNFPPEIQNDLVMETLLNNWSSNPNLLPYQTDLSLPPLKKMKFSDGELKDFSEAFATVVLSPNTYISEKSNVTLKNRNTDILNVFKKYYLAYLEGKFIDRTGTKFSKPQIKNKIGNDIISAALMVFLEAVGDLTLKTPILYKIDGGTHKYYPHLTGTKPTSLEEGIVGSKPVETDDVKCAITEKEAKIIGLLSNWGGDVAATFNKLILESLGDLEFGAVFAGGHFSIGDNETLSTLAATFLEAVGRRGVEKASLQFFWRYQSDGATNTYSKNTANFKKIDALLRTL